MNFTVSFQAQPQQPAKNTCSSLVEKQSIINLLALSPGAQHPTRGLSRIQVSEQAQYFLACFRLKPPLKSGRV